MRQWEDVWEKSYKESEAKKKVESDKERKAREDATISRYNYTLTKYVGPFMYHGLMAGVHVSSM